MLTATSTLVHISSRNEKNDFVKVLVFYSGSMLECYRSCRVDMCFCVFGWLRCTEDQPWKRGAKSIKPGKIPLVNVLTNTWLNKKAWWRF